MNITIVANFDLTKNPVDFANIISTLAAAGIQYEVLNPATPKVSAPQPTAEAPQPETKSQKKSKPVARKSTTTTKWSDEFPRATYLAYGKKLDALNGKGDKVRSDCRDKVYKAMVADGYDWWCDSKHTTKASTKYC